MKIHNDQMPNNDVFAEHVFRVTYATDFDAGDLVIVKEVDPTTLKEGGDQRAQAAIAAGDNREEVCAF